MNSNLKENNSKTLYLEAIFSTAFAFVFAITFFEISYDDSYDAFTSNLSAMQFSSFSLNDWHYLGIILIKDFLKLIQDHFQSINVLGTTFISLNTISLYYTLISLQFLILFQYGKVVRYLILMITSLFFIEHIISISHTPFATIFSGISLVNILFKDLDKRKSFLHNSIFLFGFLARPESGIGALIIISVGYLLYSFNIPKLLKKISIPLITLIVFVLTFTIHRNYTKRFEIKLEPDIEYVMSTNNIVPISEMQNQTDSIRYKMASKGMFIDTSFVNIDFLRSISLGSSSFNVQKFKVSLENVYNLYLHYLIIPVSILILLLLFLFSKKEFGLLLRILIFNTFLYLLLCYLDYHVNISSRHFTGIQVISIFVSFLIFNRSKITLLSNYIKAPAFLILFVGIFISLNNVVANHNQVINEVHCLEKVMNSFEKEIRNEIVIVGLSTFHLFDRNYSFSNNIYKKNTYLIYDASNYSIVPRYTSYLSNVCKCNASIPGDFFKWAAENDAVFITTKDRYELISEYYNYKYRKPLKFYNLPSVELIETPKCIENNINNGYEIKRVIID